VHWIMLWAIFMYPAYPMDCTDTSWLHKILRAGLDQHVVSENVGFTHDDLCRVAPDTRGCGNHP